MVRHQQYIARQRARASRHRRLGTALDVAGEKHRVAARRDAQYTARIIALGDGCGRRMQELEAHAVPAPGIACLAATRSGREGIERMRTWQRCGERPDFEGLE